MKKSTLCALALTLFVPFTAMADWTKTATDKTSFMEAWNSLEGAGNTNTIICDWVGEVNIGNVDIPTGGKIVVTSNQTKYDDMPQLLCGMNGQEMTDNNDLRLFFSNISLQYRAGNGATSGQIFYWSNKYCPVDSFVVRNCEITNIARSFYRSVPKQDTVRDENGVPISTGVDAAGKPTYDGNTFYVDGSIINYFEMSDCKVHKNMISAGNNWPLIYLGQTPKYMIIKNNTFFDTPYCKYLYQMNYITDPSGLGINTEFVFENNTVAIGAGGGGSPFQLLNPGGYLGPQSKYFINNNILAVPTYESEYITVDATGTHQPKILSATYGMVIGKNNVIDGYNTWNSGNNKVETVESWLYADTLGNYTAADVNLTWGESETFASPTTGDFSILKSNPMMTMGAEYDKATTMPTGNVMPIGPAWSYVDEFKVKAEINVTIEGSPFITYSIAPEKDAYYKGDEITITLNDHNSYYRTLNTFKGWEDGSTDIARKLVLNDAKVNLSATFEETVDYISVFDFPGFSGNGNIESYKADMYYDNNPLYQATVKLATWDKDLQNYKDSVMQTRAGKFAEIDAEQRMNILSRRTPLADKLEKKFNYVYMQLCTKGFANVNVSSYVGTDNCANSVQLLQYSLDSLNWETFAQVKLEEYMKWYELAGTLPAAAENQDTVYVRWIGDAESEPIVHPITTWEAGDAFEYIGNILVTYGGKAGIQYPAWAWFATPTYSVEPGQVESSVPGISMQFGVEGAAEDAGKTWGVSAYETTFESGYKVTNFVGGNGVNPKPYGIDKVPTYGTFYKFTTTEAGTLTAYVNCSPSKNLYFYEEGGNAFSYTEIDGTVITYDGVVFQNVEVLKAKLPLKDDGVSYDNYRGALAPVQLEANKTYYLYCSGSKLGLFGFTFESASGIEESEIAPVQTELDLNAPIYDLTGRRVVNPVKGIYLQNGKKFIVK